VFLRCIGRLWLLNLLLDLKSINIDFDHGFLRPVIERGVHYGFDWAFTEKDVPICRLAGCTVHLMQRIYHLDGILHEGIASAFQLLRIVIT
jgi:hypothetical protein